MSSKRYQCRADPPFHFPLDNRKTEWRVLVSVWDTEDSMYELDPHANQEIRFVTTGFTADNEMYRQLKHAVAEELSCDESEIDLRVWGFCP